MTKQNWTVKKVLNWAKTDFLKKGIENPRLEAELLLCAVLKWDRIKLYTDFDRPLVQDELDAFRLLIARRRNGECAAYILNEKEFWSLPFKVTPDVLVPRPDTETLVQAALDKYKSGRVLDLCTGSGCIAVSLAVEKKEMRVDAADISPKACEVAKKNIDRHGVGDRVSVHQGDLFSAIGDTQYQLVVTNPPYVIEQEIDSLSPEVQGEPRLALSGGADGLDIIRRIFNQVGSHLDSGGWLLIELDPRQADLVAKSMCVEFLGNVGDIISDLAGQKRVVACQRA